MHTILKISVLIIWQMLVIPTVPGGIPYSSRSFSWPMSVGEIESTAMSLIEQVDGIESILACKDVLSDQ